MRILHLMLSCFYIDHYSYQENLLPKYHKSAGHDVRIVASLFSFDENGNGTWLPQPSVYENEHGIRVSRLAFKNGKAAKRLRRYCGLQEELDDFRPQIIFVHGVQFCDIDIVAAYAKKHPDIRVFCDNHSDFSNSAKNILSRTVLHGIIWKRCAKKIEPYTERFYGVLPARVDFLQNVYGMPAEKCELLGMGADDELVEAASKPGVRESIRERYGIGKDDFLIMYGGKTDHFKQQVFLLMDAVNQINDPRIKLIVFGSVLSDLKSDMEARVSDKVQYIGWIKSSDSYEYFAACDLACFPGRHSVFWEQVAAQGVPLLVKKWDGTTHIDCGGNTVFLTQDSVEEIREAILRIADPSFYDNMKKSAEKSAGLFLYSDIAQKSIR